MWITINIEIGPVLLIKWNAKQRCQSKIQVTEELIVILVEEATSLREVIIVEENRISGNVDGMHMHKLKTIYLPSLCEGKLIPEGNILLAQQMQHLLLSKWCEQEPELDLVVPIRCSKQRLEISIL